MIGQALYIGTPNIKCSHCACDIIGNIVHHNTFRYIHTSAQVVLEEQRFIVFLFLTNPATLCLNFINPLLEYNNVIWGPHYVIDKHKVEAIQRNGYQNGSHYHDRLHYLKLLSYSIEGLGEIYYFASNDKTFLQYEYQKILVIVYHHIKKRS